MAPSHVVSKASTSPSTHGTTTSCENSSCTTTAATSRGGFEAKVEEPHGPSLTLLAPNAR